MNENRIKEIANDIEKYHEAIANVEGALAEAERELDEELEKCIADKPVTDYPD